MQRFKNSYKVSHRDKAAKVIKVQDILEELLRVSYPYVSEGRGFTNPLCPLTHLSFKILPDFIPEGEEFSTLVTLGQHEKVPFNVRVWKEKKMVKVRPERGGNWFWRARVPYETGKELMINGALPLLFFLKI